MKKIMGSIKTIIYFIINCPKYFFIGLTSIISFLPYYIIIGIKFIFSKKSSNNYEIKKIEKKFVPLTILTLSITTYLISIFILTRWYVQSERSKKFTNSFEIPLISEENTSDKTEPETESNQYEDSITPPPVESNNNEASTKPSKKPSTSNKIKINKNFINVNLNSYIQKNSETVAWIQVNGTKVNYPVVQHKNNDFYLKHDFNKRKTTNGWIFADYRNNFKTFDNNTIIYGHNLINNTMFGTIPNFLNKIKPTTDYLQAKFNSTTTYQDFLDLIKNRSYYDFNISPNYTDKIITLSTCDNTGTKRVVVHAKLISIESK